MSDLYVHGAAVIDNVLSQKGSLKGLVMAQARHAGGKGNKHQGGKSKTDAVDAKRLLALTANTLAFLKPLSTVLESSDVLALEKRTLSGRNLRDKEGQQHVSAKALALVLAHDLLLTKRARIATSPAWPPHAALQRHAARLRAELVKLQIKEGKKSVQELRAGEATRLKVARIPRWVRLNERKGASTDLFATLEAHGWTEVHEASELMPKVKSFVRSRHVANVIAVHPAQTSALIQSTLYKDGHIMLQDLASCLPAEILVESGLKGQVHGLDATSAPGNKTSHLSAKLSQCDAGSDVVAIEHMQPRYKTLVEQLRRAGCLDNGAAGQVMPQLADFMKQHPNDYANVTHMLLDPSCSGSGILGRLDFLTDEEQEQSDPTEESEGVEDGDLTATAPLAARLQKLAAFQGSMIEHAMQFPSLRRLTYSTCSIHHEENEDVVMKALQSEVAAQHGWRLATRQQVIPTWPTRGLAEHCGGDETLSEAMIRCVPGGADESITGLSMDATNGFFVALFVRDGGSAATDLPASNSNTAKNRKRKQRAKEKAKAAKKLRQEEADDDST